MENSKLIHGFRERMAGENSYTVCFEAVPKQQLRTDFILLVSDVFPRYRDSS